MKVNIGDLLIFKVDEECIRIGVKAFSSLLFERSK